MFLLYKYSKSRGFNFEWQTQCAVLLLYSKQKFLRRNTKVIHSLILLLGLTHSSLLQCIWNFESLQLWFSICNFFPSPFSCDFQSFFFYLGVVDSHSFFMYQSSPISCNKNWHFPFWLSVLGCWTGVFLNKVGIPSIYTFDWAW